MKPIDIKSVKNLNIDLFELPSEITVIPTKDNYVKGLDKKKDKLKEAEAKQAIKDFKNLLGG